MKKPQTNRFESVWDAIAATPEEAANLRVRSEWMDKISEGVAVLSRAVLPSARTRLVAKLMHQRDDVFLRQRWCVRIGELTRKAVEEFTHSPSRKRLQLCACLG